MSIQPISRTTPSEYLEAERKAETKSEYINGQIYAMAGASEEHNIITLNIGAELRACLKGKPCRTYASDMRVRVSETGMYTYPDVAVVCGQPEFADASVDTLTNPTLLVEVSSPSTEAYDRGAKFAHFRKLPSLREYLLVAQDRPHVERYARQDDGQWLLKEWDEVSDTLALSSIDCVLPLAEIYDRISFLDAQDGAE